MKCFRWPVVHHRSTELFSYPVKSDICRMDRTSGYCSNSASYIWRRMSGSIAAAGFYNAPRVVWTVRDLTRVPLNSVQQPPFQSWTAGFSSRCPCWERGRFPISIGMSFCWYGTPDTSAPLSCTQDTAAGSRNNDCLVSSDTPLHLLPTAEDNVSYFSHLFFGSAGFPLYFKGWDSLLFLSFLPKFSPFCLFSAILSHLSEGFEPTWFHAALRVKAP